MSALRLLQQQTWNGLFLTEGNTLQARVAILLHLYKHTDRFDNPCAVLVTDEGERVRGWAILDERPAVDVPERRMHLHRTG